MSVEVPGCLVVVSFLNSMKITYSLSTKKPGKTRKAVKDAGPEKEETKKGEEEPS